MLKWIMILVVVTGSYRGGVAVHSIETADKNSCDRIGQRSVVAARAVDLSAVSASYTCTQVRK